MALGCYLDIKVKIEKGKNLECKGRVYKCYINSYMSRTTIQTHKSLRLLKRKSCQGCDKCGWMDEALQLEIEDDHKIDFLADLENGKMYKLNSTWHPGPFEYPKDGDLEIHFDEITKGE